MQSCCNFCGILYALDLFTYEAYKDFSGSVRARHTSKTVGSMFDRI